MISFGFIPPSLAAKYEFKYIEIGMRCYSLPYKALPGALAARAQYPEV